MTYVRVVKGCAMADCVRNKDIRKTLDIHSQLVRRLNFIELVVKVIYKEQVVPASHFWPNNYQT